MAKHRPYHRTAVQAPPVAVSFQESVPEFIRAIVARAQQGDISRHEANLVRTWVASGHYTVTPEQAKWLMKCFGASERTGHKLVVQDLMARFGTPTLH